MKKFILFALFATILVSCEKPQNGKNGKDGLLSIWHVIELPVSSTDWQPMPSSSNVRYYSAFFSNIPEITKDIFLDGVVLCYLYQNDRQIMLPTVRHYESDNGELWTSTIDFEYFEGGLEIFYTNSDFFYTEPPQDMTFVLQILY
ncbi:MAG: hypothetical protein LBS50_01455 [Prevotellaceae bacterium]|jgi:hypothetical protein|nr:hypothetical protein [Prevotellaceae bacterium]